MRIGRPAQPVTACRSNATCSSRARASSFGASQVNYGLNRMIVGCARPIYRSRMAPSRVHLSQPASLPRQVRGRSVAAGGEPRGLPTAGGPSAPLGRQLVQLAATESAASCHSSPGFRSASRDPSRKPDSGTRSEAFGLRGLRLYDGCGHGRPKLSKIRIF